MGFWDKIRSIFVKKEKNQLDYRFKDDDLEYDGDEPVCWACQMSIHKSQRKRKLNGNYLHGFCFKKIKKIALNGGGIDDFS